MSDANRTLNLSLKFTADTAAGSKALAALAGDLQKVQSAAGAAQKALGGGGGAGGGSGLASGGIGGAYGAGAGRPDATAQLLDRFDRLTRAMIDLAGVMKQGGGGGGGSNDPFKHPLDDKKEDEKRKYEHDKDKKGTGEKFVERVTKAAGVGTAMAGLLQTATNLHSATAQLNHEWLTTNERTQAFARAIPLVGDALAHLMSSVTSALDRLDDPKAADALARKQWYYPIQEAKEGIQSQANMREFGLARQVSQAQSQAWATARYQSLGAGIAGGGDLDLGRHLMGGGLSGDGGVAGAFGSLVGVNALGGGELAARRPIGVDPYHWRLGESNAITDAMARVQAARREYGRAQADAGDSDTLVTGARGRAHDAKAAADRAWAEYQKQNRAAGITRPGEPVRDLRGEAARRAAADARGAGFDPSGPVAAFSTAGAWLFPSWTDPHRRGPDMPGTDTKRMDALLEAQRASGTAAKELAELEQRISDSKEKQLSLAQKANDLRQAETNMMKTQLSLLDQEREQVKGAGRSFAAMDKPAQAALYDAASRFKERGRGGVTREELGMLQGNSLTGDMVNQMLDKEARSDPNFKKFRELVGARDMDTIEKERATVKAAVDMKIQLDEEQFQKTMAESLKKLNLEELLKGVIINQIELKLRGVEMGAERARADRAAGG